MMHVFVNVSASLMYRNKKKILVSKLIQKMKDFKNPTLQNGVWTHPHDLIFMW